jgi:ubiquinone biosynthesis accessory factor UbiK
MIDAAFLDDVASKLGALLPPSLQAVKNDVQQQFRQILMHAFTQLDLVSREEFDIQRKVLARTRAKVEALEKQLTAYEQQSS